MVQVSEGFVSSNYYITNIFFNTLPHKKQQQKQQQQQQQQHQLYTPSPSFFLLTHVHVLLSPFELYNMDDTTRRADIIGNCPVEIFDSSKEKEPNLINPGDSIVFKKINIDQYKEYESKK